MPKRKTRPVSQAEQKDGVYEAEHRGQKFEKLVESKMGSDGVPESHISYKPRTTKVFFIPK